MPFPISLVPVALSAIQSLVKFRDRVDVVLSLHKAGEPLPLLLPPPPTDYAPYAQPMREFFQSERGAALLALQHREEEFRQVLADPDEEDDSLFKERKELYELYFAANNIQPAFEAPEDPETESDPRARPDGELQLAAYIVESHRLSRNPAVTRILLATANTVLEIAGANAGFFISNPRTRAIVETLIRDFAGQQDFDDQSFDRIFKRLLSATMVAALDAPGVVPDRPALQPLLRALADVRRELGDDFVAELATMPGFEQLLSRFLTHTAEDPSFVTKDALAQKVIGATLAEAGRNVVQLRTDPQAFIGVLEAGLKVGAANVNGVLARELGGKPLAAALVGSVAQAVAGTSAPIRQLVRGELWAAVYQTALATISASPAVFGHDAQAQTLAGALVAALSDAVEKHDLRAIFDPEILRTLLTRTMILVAARPELLGRKAEPTLLAIIGAALRSGAAAAGDGRVVPDELLEIAEAALGVASTLKPGFGGQLSEILQIMGMLLSDTRIANVTTPGERKALLLSMLGATTANPRLWGAFAEEKKLRPILEAVLLTLATHPEDVLDGSPLTAAGNAVLLQIARRGRMLLDGSVTPEQLSAFLALALQAADRQTGLTIDREGALRFLDLLLAGYLRQPFAPANLDMPEFRALATAALATLDSH